MGVAISLGSNHPKYGKMRRERKWAQEMLLHLMSRIMMVKGGLGVVISNLKYKVFEHDFPDTLYVAGLSQIQQIQ